MIRRSIPFLLLGLAAAVGVQAQQKPFAVDSQMIALDEELGLHPELGVTDIYKLLHQGAFGPAHAIADWDSATRYLADEVAALGATESPDPLCQALGGDPAKARIHLRPFVAAGGDQHALVEAFVASASAVTASTDEMNEILEAAVSRLVRRSRYQLAGQLEDLAGRLAEEDFPPVHHSDGYVAAYRPAYRVVLVELARQHGWCQ
jgi:hypothetical protein